MKITLNVLRFAALSACLAAHSLAEDPVKWDAQGNLLQPQGYREWIYVGTPVTPNELNGGKAAFPEFHNVYIDPGAYAAYKKTGEFPDGTVMIKELTSVGAKVAASGAGYFEGEFIGLEASIKSAAKHPHEPGHWGYYSFTDEGKPVKPTAALQAAANCNACHLASAKQDYVFTQYYPVLRAAKK